MTDSDATGQIFLALVKDKAQEVREIYRRNWWPVAIARGRRFTPMSFRDAVEEVLLEIMRNDTDAANRARAANLYLEGKDRHWAIDPRDERDARAFAATQHERQPAMPKPKQPKVKTKLKPRPRANADEKERTKRNLAIARECALLEYAMKRGSVEEKLDAIHAWFVAIEYLAPEKLHKPLINTKECANDRS